MPGVLIFLAFGGLLISPTLHYASTALNSGRNMEKDMRAIYTAEAAVEHALWKLKNAPPSSYPHSYELTGINGLAASVTVERVTTIYGIILGSPGQHSEYMDVDSALTYNEVGGYYNYSVTVSNLQSSVIHLSKILVKIPAGFQYIQGSTGGDFTTANPQIKGDVDTGLTLSWDFGSPRPKVGGYTTKTHTFRLNGPVPYSGSSGSAWVVTTRSDIGYVGSSDAFGITVQAKEGGNVLTTVRAGVLDDSDINEMIICSWEIYPGAQGG